MKMPNSDFTQISSLQLLNNLTEQSKRYTWGLSPLRWRAREPGLLPVSLWVSGMPHVAVPWRDVVWTVLTKAQFCRDTVGTR